MITHMPKVARSCQVREEVPETVNVFCFCRFWGSFEPIFDPFVGGNINIRILPPTNESKIGQNGSQKRRNQNALTVSKPLLPSEELIDYRYLHREYSCNNLFPDRKRTNVCWKGVLTKGKIHHCLHNWRQLRLTHTSMPRP